jgi:hypothetical protein
MLFISNPFWILARDRLSHCWSASPCRPHDGGRRHEVRIVQARGVPINFLLGNIMGFKQSPSKLLEIRSHEGDV